jgi:signal transduction histidine kinase
MGIFGLIIVSGVIVTFVIINVATATQFRRFVLSGDIIRARNLSKILADYYTRQGSWNGVDSLLKPDASSYAERLKRTMENAKAIERATNPNGGETVFEAPAQSGSYAERIVLAGPEGYVIADTAGMLLGQYHPEEHLVSGVPVTVGTQQAGTVMVGSMVGPVLNPLDRDFLRSVSIAVILSAVTVGVMALILGSVFFFQITAPIRDLTTAAEAIAEGNLECRVRARTGDEIGQLAAHFNLMAETLARSAMLRRQIAVDIAHEFRTPLSLIQGNLEAILDGFYDLSMDNITSVHEETLVLKRLVDDLHSLALAEAEQLRLDKQDVDVSELIIHTVGRFRSKSAERGVCLITELPSDLPKIRGDSQRLSQVLVNLLSNAFRFTTKGGKVVVAARPTSGNDVPEFDKEQDIAGKTEKEARFVHISVSDSGKGIPPEDLPYVFERFYRADRSRARSSGGTGLGLAITRHIVEAHGGRIRADSCIGVGSTFSFILPV